MDTKWRRCWAAHAHCHKCKEASVISMLLAKCRAKIDIVIVLFLAQMNEKNTLKLYSWSQLKLSRFGAERQILITSTDFNFLNHGPKHAYMHIFGCPIYHPSPTVQPKMNISKVVCKNVCQIGIYCKHDSMRVCPLPYLVVWFIIF